MRPRVRAWVGLGANLGGGRDGTAGQDWLHASQGVQVVAHSALYCSAPVDARVPTSSML